MENAKVLASEIKRAVKGNHQLTCSIGVAPNKSAAKIATDRNKPDGLTVVPSGSVEAFLAPLPVSVVPGVGAKTEEFLREKGVQTIAQLQAVDGEQLISWFGKNGIWLWGVIHGQENIEVRQRELPKSLSVERTFGKDLADFGEVRREALDAASELVRRVKASGLVYRIGGVKIRFRGFETHSREKSLTTYTDSAETLHTIVETLLKEFEREERPVRLVGVRVSDLHRANSSAARLDEWTAS
jgi:DNA polymerase IV (DinB-like DNA polymerase)